MELRDGLGDDAMGNLKNGETIFFQMRPNRMRTSKRTYIILLVTVVEYFISDRVGEIMAAVLG